MSLEITGEHYRIVYDPAITTITCEGSLRLYGADGFLSISAFEKSRMAEGRSQPGSSTARGEYSSIRELLYDVADKKPTTITVDLRDLETLNSSGVNVFSKFVLRVRSHKTSQLVIQGKEDYLWQRKVLKNFKKLMPDLRLEWEK